MIGSAGSCEGLYDVIFAPVPADAAACEAGVSLICRGQSEAILAFFIATVEDYVCNRFGSYQDGDFCCCRASLCLASGLHVLDIELAVSCVFILPKACIV